MNSKQCCISERKNIIELIKNNFYPLDYGRWQADELLSEVLLLIENKNE